MKNHCLAMKWHYTYDKESTWFDEDEGTVEYLLESNVYFTLPHIDRKRVEMLSVTQEGEVITVELKVDGYSKTVRSDAEPVIAHVSYDYMAAGDSVTQQLTLEFSIVDAQ